jgi:hypothetical protein
MSERITLNKMKKNPTDRKIRYLIGWFRYRGDYLKWTHEYRLTVVDAVKSMEMHTESTGYYLTWEVCWERDI